MTPGQVQALVLRAPHGPAVAHLVFPVQGRSRMVLQVLRDAAQVSFGPQPADQPCCSLGFSFEGLRALRVPEGYLRLFRRLAPAFRDGAVLRSTALGDSGPSAAQNWLPSFQPSQAHVVLSWLGTPEQVRQKLAEFEAAWRRQFPARPLPVPLLGQRLGAPSGQTGEWVHFGFRDGISEVSIDEELPRPQAKDLRSHAPGTLLLGHLDDAGTNPFALSLAPDKVRRFFHHSSFGILRPMLQDVAAFDGQVQAWTRQLAPLYKPPVTSDFVKAKLCGRWPDGRLPLPGQTTPGDEKPSEETPGETARGETKPANDPFVIRSGGKDFPGDEQGEGCPFGSHVRRMRAPLDGNGLRFERPLQRRSVPFGSATWRDGWKPGEARGLLGHFFCASIEDQFEHLLGQWAAGPPLGFPRDDLAPDPLIGPHQDADAALRVPLKSRPAEHLSGFRAWTTTQGTVYAWYPGRDGLQALLDNNFVPDENDDERPWQ